MSAVSISLHKFTHISHAGEGMSEGYGFFVFDEYESDVCDTFATLEELQAALAFDAPEEILAMLTASMPLGDTWRQAAANAGGFDVNGAFYSLEGMVRK